LTQRLLAFARRQELKPEAIRIAELVSGIETLLERALGGGVWLETEIDRDLPAVLVDHNQLELALLNLAVNGRDAMPDGGCLRISAEAFEAGEGEPGLSAGRYVRIRVADTGIGMDELTLSKASEPFFTTKGTGKGTGLGLSMVHGLAAQSGGSLRISSRLGSGTIVELFLPQAEPESETPAPYRSPLGGLRGVVPNTVLIVDDDALVRTSAAAMLEELGHRVFEAPSGAEALNILRANPEIDLLITDHSMPEMTGTELAAQSRKLYPQLKILLATGYAELPPGNAGSLPRLAKPFGIAELAAAIAQVAEPRAATIKLSA
jgi:CheY-like chemotaxis protein/anti-sigma regulatory factor (Ser/Thr protein kinase)